MTKTIALATATAVVALGAAAGSAQAQSRDQISIVGSSTVFPFATVVAERFGQTTDFPTPRIESTGSGGGLRLFCQGVGVEHPDITNASRAIKASEQEACAENGVTAITEVKIGYDGIVVAADGSAEQLDLSKEQLWSALAEQVVVDGELVANPATNWSDVDSALPDVEIAVYGPPPTSGTRDAFEELVMETGCPVDAIAEILGDEDAAEDQCTVIREDGAYVDAGENDNLIVQRLQASPEAVGIFGFSFYDQNRDSLVSHMVGGVAPTFESISSGDYGVSRSLFFYVKNAHVGVIPGMEEYLAEFTSDQAIGPEGYLIDRGLIPLPEGERTDVRERVANLTPMEMPN